MESAAAKEPVRISGLTWPGYGFWYIAIEKDLAPDLDIIYGMVMIDQARIMPMPSLYY